MKTMKIYNVIFVVVMLVGPASGVPLKAVCACNFTRIVGQVSRRIITDERRTKPKRGMTFIQHLQAPQVRSGWSLGRSNDFPYVVTYPSFA